MQNPSTIDHYDYHLPENLIARFPKHNRTDSRLLAVLAGKLDFTHDRFANILNYLKPGDTLVLNDTKVFPARLQATKESGGKVELLLSRPLGSNTWLSLINSSRRLKPGALLSVESLTAKIIGKDSDDEGAYIIEFDGNIHQLAQNHGQLPIPPYMQRKADEMDSSRYQTVFADEAKNLAVAAPTAGLHFDVQLLDTIRAKGINIIHITLHVGPGTFLPMRTSNIDEHKMHAEHYVLEQNAADILNQTRKQGGRIVAVGTTVVRTLESSLAQNDDGIFSASSGLTRIFIKPGYTFKAVDALITNFHLPKSTLLLLVSAFAGRERIMKAYEEAIQLNYQFFSYGDACYLEKCNGI